MDLFYVRNVRRRVKQTANLVSPGGRVKESMGDIWAADFKNRVIMWTPVSMNGGEMDNDETLFKVAHEAAHLHYTGGFGWPSGITSLADRKMFFSIVNWIEDARIERLMAERDLRGFKSVREKYYRDCFQLRNYTGDPYTDNDIIGSVMGTISFIYEHNLGDINSVPRSFRSLVEKCVGYYMEGARQPSTNDIVPFAKNIWDVIFETQESEGEDPSGEDPGEGESSYDREVESPESDDKGTNDQESEDQDPLDESTSSDQGDQSDPGDQEDQSPEDQSPSGDSGDGEESSDESSGGSGEDSDGSEDQSESGSESDSGENQGEDSPETPSEDEGEDLSDEETDATGGNSAGSSTGDKETADNPYRSGHNEEDDNRPGSASNLYEKRTREGYEYTEMFYPPGSRVGDNTHSPHGASEWEIIKTANRNAINTLSRRLQTTLRHNAMDANEHGQRRGRLDSRRAYKTVSGNNRIFSKRNAVGGLDYTFGVMIDVSGSMLNLHNRVNIATPIIVISEAIEKAGMELFVVVWDGHPRAIKKISTPLAKVRGLLGSKLRPSGGTYEAPALALASEEFRTTGSQKKVLIEITDGETRYPEQSQALIKELSDSGVYCLGIGLAGYEPPGYWPHKMTVGTIDDLSRELSKFVANMVNRG